MTILIIILFLIISAVSTIIWVNVSHDMDRAFLANMAGCSLLVAFILTIFNLIGGYNDKDPLKDLTHIQKNQLFELCIKTPECDVNTLFPQTKDSYVVQKY